VHFHYIHWKKEFNNQHGLVLFINQQRDTQVFSKFLEKGKKTALSFVLEKMQPCPTGAYG
jgi:hypothetical protein